MMKVLKSPTTQNKTKMLFCLLGLLLHSSKAQPNKLLNQSDFENYLDLYDDTYAEKGTTPPDLGDAVTGHITFRKNWNFAGFGEVPYLVIFYKRIYDKKSFESYVKLTPGNYCGGMRLTVMRFITSCRCLNSWYHWKVSALSYDFRPWEKDPYNIEARRIFVTALRSGVTFEPDDQFELDTSDLGQCGHGKSPKVEAIIVKFKPVDQTQDTPEFEPEELLRWPPKPLPQLESQPGAVKLEYPENALKGILFSFGMVSKNWVDGKNQPIRNDFGEIIDVNETAVSVNVKEVPLMGDCLYNLNAKWKLLDDQIRREETADYTLVCFQVIEDPIKRNEKPVTICGGAPGFPILRDGTVHGVIVEPLDCDTGYVITLSFDNVLKEKIEDVIDPYHLNVAQEDQPKMNPKISDPVEKAYQYAYFWDLYEARAPEAKSKSASNLPNWRILNVINTLAYLSFLFL